MAYLRFLRRERGLRQHDVAAALSVEYKQVSRWERGENDPPAALLAAYAAFVGGIDATIAALIRDSQAGESDGIAAAQRDLAIPPIDPSVLAILERLERKIDALADDVQQIKRDIQHTKAS